MIKISSVSIIISFILSSCSAPIPTIEHKEQKITSIQTKQLDKIKILASELVRINAPTIYIYVEKDGAVRESGTGAGELPKSMKRAVKSILMDFGPRVKVIDSASGIVFLLKNQKHIKNRIFSLNGAITMYDKNIMSQSSGIDTSINFGKSNGEGSSSGNFKDKDSLSILGMDFYLKSMESNEILLYKTSSKITLKTTTRGYSFGIFINDGGFGMSAYKTLQDGVGLSVRKLLQESMYDLIKQAYAI